MCFFLPSLTPASSQGTLLGGIEYLVQSNDNADIVSDEDRFKYIDDLSVLEVVYLAGLLTEYNFYEHVASDIATGQPYLPPSRYNSQQTFDSISNWTEANLMMINEEKSNFMIFSRAETDFATRLQLNGNPIERLNAAKICRVWLTEDLSWNLNTEELCKKAYKRLSMLTKLRYVGVGIEDLIDVYSPFIRSVLEYCSVVWHSWLTLEQISNLERVQKICLRVILRENYVSYEAALEMCGLERLVDRRESRCMQFAKRCLKHPKFKNLFPHSEPDAYKLRQVEKYKVNFARTSHYRDSAIPYLQRKLNVEEMEKKTTC
jgi:hypothetical protein